MPVLPAVRALVGAGAGGPGLRRAGQHRLPPDELPGPGLDHELLARAAAASGCAADQGRFLDFALALFTHQPPEGGPGLSDAELASLGRSAGLADAPFTDCLSEAPYLDWPGYVTARATEAGVTGTPTVLVAGTMVQANGRTIAAAVQRASRAR